MKEDLKNLYSSLIKEHNKNPLHFEKQSDDVETVAASNPICGDRFDVFVKRDGAQISQLHFHGFGCAISKSSTSILVKTLEGKSVEESLRICENFLAYVCKGLPSAEKFYTEDFNAFAAVHAFPARLDCATLSWKEMKKYLEREKRKIQEI